MDLDSKVIIGAVIAVVILLAFVPVVVDTVRTAHINQTGVLNESHEITAGKAFAVSIPPLWRIETIYNNSNGTPWNSAQYTILYPDNGTMNMSYSGTVRITYVTEGENGIGSASVVLLGLVILIFIAGVFFFIYKKMDWG